jgi:hypothetical protein
MISSIFSPFWAVFVTRRKNMMNVMRFLLRFITVFKATSSGYELFRKILAKGWENSLLRSKKSNGRRNLHRAHFIRGHRDCQANDGGLVKSRDKCPLLSARVAQELFSFSNLGRMNLKPAQGAMVFK